MQAGEGIPDVSSVIAAVGVIQRNFAHVGYTDRAVTQSRIVRFEEMEKYREAAILYAEALKGGSERQFLRRAGVMAVALETLRWQPGSASEFWNIVAHNNAPEFSPGRALLSWLRNIKRTGGDQSQREHCKAAALAWNADFLAEDRKSIKPNAMGAFCLLGTPWDKGIEKRWAA